MNIGDPELFIRGSNIFILTTFLASSIAVEISSPFFILQVVYFPMDSYIPSVLFEGSPMDAAEYVPTKRLNVKSAFNLILRGTRRET